MEQITVPLTDPAVKEFVEGVVSGGGYGSAGDYVLALIREDQIRRKRARVEALLLEGLEGEPSGLTGDDWDEMRRRYEERNPEGGEP